MKDFPNTCNLVNVLNVNFIGSLCRILPQKMKVIPLRDFK